ncbi:MAG TPA: thioesterase family protein [Stellaceae bacterium]|nr:thioesterase family protein [Stellaceae bacterium]
MAGEGELRESYRHFLAIPTRWIDNDVYGHVNNVRYYEFFDTVVNRYYIEAGGLDIYAGPVIGLVVETMCRYHEPLAYPETVDAGLRVAHLGRTSVRHEIGLFRAGVSSPAATGHFIHVFVDRASRRPAPIPERIRAALEKLRVG